MGDWSYEQWVRKMVNAVMNNDEREQYNLVAEIYDQGSYDGYGLGFGDGKVCCGGPCCECGDDNG
jgi:hypothetical protein